MGRHSRALGSRPYVTIQETSVWAAESEVMGMGEAIMLVPVMR